MKKYIRAVGAIVIALVLCVLPGASRAETDTSNSLRIQILQEQIRLLLAQLQELKAATPATFCYSFDRDITFGSSSDDVVALRKVLQLRGISPVSETSFSEETAGDVVSLQAKLGVRQTGYVGPLTRAKLNALYRCGTVPLTQETKPVSTGPFVGLSANLVTGALTITEGQSVTFNWGTTNAVSCSSSGGTSNWAQSSRPTLGQVELASPILVSATYTITCVDKNGVSGSSSVRVNVKEFQVQPMTVLAPNAGEAWLQGNKYNITWLPVSGDFDAYEALLGNRLVPGTLGGGPTFTQIPKNLTSTSFNPLDLSDNLIKSWVANSGGVSESLIRQNFYYVVRAVKNGSTDKGGRIIAEGKSGTFSILSNPTPSITVNSPNGGEQLTAGFGKDVDFRVSWGIQNLTGNVSVYLNFADGATCLLGTTQVSQGSFPVVLGNNFQCPNIPRTVTSGQYKILLDTDTNPNNNVKGVGDSSDGFFTLTVMTVPKTMSIVSPQSGELLTQSTVYPFQWKTTGLEVSNSVYIELIGNGRVYTLAKNLTNTGRASLFLLNDTTGFTIPGGSYQLRICADQKESICDQRTINYGAKG